MKARRDRHEMGHHQRGPGGSGRMIDFPRNRSGRQRQADRHHRRPRAGARPSSGPAPRMSRGRRVLGRLRRDGAALIRRDGRGHRRRGTEFPWQFAGNLQKWAGKWNDLPVDPAYADCPLRPVSCTSAWWPDRSMERPQGRVPRHVGRRPSLPPARAERPGCLEIYPRSTRRSRLETWHSIIPATKVHGGPGRLERPSSNSPLDISARRQ